MYRAQYLAAAHCRRMNTILGVPTVALSAAVGTSIFASFASKNNTIWLAVTGGVSLLAAVLGAVQAFFRYAEQAEKHRGTGATYAGLKRELDVLALRIRLEEIPQRDGLHALAEIVARIDRLQAESLEVPDRLYDRARREQDLDTEGV